MNLTNKQCIPCEGGTPPLAWDKVQTLLQEVPDWQVEEGKLVRRIRFPDFVQTIEFVNKMAELAEVEGHHPDFCVTGYNKLAITLYTHSIGGLSENDFILAAKMNQIRVPERKKSQTL